MSSKMVIMNTMGLVNNISSIPDTCEDLTKVFVQKLTKG